VSSVGISKSDLVDADIVDASELASDGTAIYLTVSVVSTTSGTKTVVVGATFDGEGISTSRDHPVAPTDLVTLSGTSGGLANGTFTVASVTDDSTFVVVESIGTSTGGTANFKYPSGSLSVGFDPTKQNLTAASNGQQVVTDVANAALLNEEPNGLGVTYTVTRTGGDVTQEKWVRTSNTFNIKTIDYTYSSGKVSTEVRKVYAASNGTTILAQETITYSYSGNSVVGSTIVRNV